MSDESYLTIAGVEPACLHTLWADSKAFYEMSHG